MKESELGRPLTGRLLRATARGTGWVVAWRAASRSLGLISTLVLVRILAPADFGLVALAMSFSMALDGFADLGVSEAVIRQDEVDRSLYDTAFTLNAIRGLATALLVGLAAYPVAGFFGDERLGFVLLMIAASMIFPAFENIRMVDFRRQLSFEKEFQVWVIPRVAQVVVAIVVALLWKNYWALIAGIGTARSLRCIGSYLVRPYRPRITLVSWRKIAFFSLWTWPITVVSLIGDRSTSFVMGRVFGPAVVGVYALGQEIAALPFSELIDPICRVSFSSFSEARRDGGGTAAVYTRIIGLTAALTVPACLGIAILAEQIVRLAFGPKWLAVTPVIQILSVAGVFMLVGRLSATIVSAYAHLRSMFVVRSLAVSLQCVFLLVCVPQWGLVGAALVTACVALAENATYALIAGRILGVRVGDLFRNVWRSLLAAVVMAVCLMTLGVATPKSTSLFASAAILLGSVGMGFCVYTATLVLLWVLVRRPTGAESDLFGMVKHILGYARGVRPSKVA